MTSYLRQGIQLTNPDGTPSREFLRLFNGLVDQVGGQGRDKVGETEITQSGIIDGTKPINAQITGLGRLSSLIDAQNANINAATQTAGAGGALIATTNPAQVSGEENTIDTVTVTTAPVTFTATGGTAPYTCLITKKNVADNDIPPSNATPPASGAGLNEFTVTFSRLVEAFGFYSSNYCATITDGVGATFEVCLAVNVTNLGGGAL